MTHKRDKQMDTKTQQQEQAIHSALDECNHLWVGLDIGSLGDYTTIILLERQ